MKEMYELLSERPIIGILSGFGSGLLINLQTGFTDTQTLSIVGATGVWVGASVAVITLTVKLIEITQNITAYYRKRKADKRRRNKGSRGFN